MVVYGFIISPRFKKFRFNPIFIDLNRNKKG